jgi:membrane protease YdiL (CAAX protease family)
MKNKTMMSRLTDLENDKYGLKTIFHIIIVIFIFALTQLVGGVIVDMIYLSTRLNLRVLFVILRCVFEIGLFILSLYLYVSKVLKLNMSYFRITKPRFSLLWMIIAIMLPAFVILYYFIFTNGKISYGSSESRMLYIVYALKLGLTAGITEELLFRGFIMKLIENRWNIKVAVIVPSVIFTSLHLFKGMGSIDVLLVFIAGITVSVMFSLVTYLNDNIWNAVIMHTMWNLLVIGIFWISPQNDFQNLINYVINSSNILVTGGRFGIESGLPAIIGYTIVIIIALVLGRKNHHKKTG